MVKCVGTAANVMNKYEVLGVVGEGKNIDEIMDMISLDKLVAKLCRLCRIIISLHVLLFISMLLYIASGQSGYSIRVPVRVSNGYWRI